MRRTSRGNRLTYALWSPLYDRLIGLAPFRRGRAKAHERLALQAGERVLLVGVGTGIDFPFLPVGIEAVGVDLSQFMLARARKRLPIDGRQVELLQADAQAMPLVDDTFDAAFLALILSVVPDGGHRTIVRGASDWSRRDARRRSVVSDWSAGRVARGIA